MISSIGIKLTNLSILGTIVFILSIIILNRISKKESYYFSLILSGIISLLFSVIYAIYQYFFSKVQIFSFSQNIIIFSFVPAVINIIILIIKVFKNSKLITIPIMLFFLFNAFIQFINLVLPILKINYKLYYFFILGIFLAKIFSLLYKKNDIFLSLEHELTHGLFVIFSGGEILSISVEKNNGGLITMDRSNFLISLSPYFFPTILLIFLLFSEIIGLPKNKIYYIINGILFYYHISSTIKETHSKQTDLLKHGLYNSYLFVFLMNFIIVSSILLFLSTGYIIAFNFILKVLKIDLVF